ncbi:MAG TPA: ATP-binding protein [Gemmataceae bacterium]|nr:ATP-binding protein [Gemmataceae bacterium]
MRSIRLSLLIYWLVLLGLALGAVSLLVYNITLQTLLARKEYARGLLLAKNDNARRLLEQWQKTRGDFLEARCREREQEEHDRLDETLLSEARTLATLVRYQFQFNHIPYVGPYPLLGLLTAGLSPNGYVLVPVWVAESVESPLNAPFQIQLQEENLLTSEEEDTSYYYQINSSWGPSWRSRSLGDRWLPFNPGRFADKVLDWEADDVELERGLVVRRVVLKAPVARIIYLRRPNSPDRRPERPPPPRPPRPDFVGPPSPPRERPRPPIYIQCAADTTEREIAITKLRLELDEDLKKLRADVKEELARLDAELDDELNRLEAESGATLASLRNHLLLISLITFAAAGAGVFGLVHLGLAPLRRLSVAVSRVSTKDFRLPFEERRLPVELRPIVDRLNETLDQLKRAFAREKQAAADISHELRTPLTALLTTIEVGLRKSRTPEEYRELLEECRASGQQMSQLVEHLLTLARLDAGVAQVRPRPVDAAEVARQCAAVVRPLAEARGLSLQLKCPDVAALTTDPDKLREVMNNLLHNAIEYNRPDGSVELTVERRNGHLCLEVRDTGIGIAPEAREHIFERFYRADPSRQADGLHAGLGLAIVKGYVELMGGTIAVESEPGQGSTFRILLPAGDDKVTR